ncbi:DMT family transporter [Clostridium sp. WLY-B-L2]|uniref:DMT family transporter n=1 Tax=Clostridium aromativorans TaxID=2836848 RepID=A0ABS8NA20_9CLOT|nr:DMT family transporter [Clostridium aromativorans]MCC9296651.1 DMT family transporter [Clostridium aromativorans]
METHKSRKKFIADLFLLLAAMLWGGGYAATKDALNSITPLYMMAIRFLCAGILISVIFFKIMMKITLEDITRGFIIGIFLFLAYTAQTVGLNYTTASKQSFLTSVYVIILPFLYWAVFKTKPTHRAIISAIISLIGIGILSFKSNMQLNINIGDWLTLLSAVLFASHIISIACFTRKSNPIILSVVQMMFAGIFSLLFAIIFEPSFSGIHDSALFPIFYLVVFSTMIGFLIQNIAQKYTNPNHVGILLSLESVFGAIISMIFLNEVFTLNMIIGCSIIFLSVFISETKLKFTFKRNSRNIS